MKLFTSRTVWTIIGIVCLNTLQAIAPFTSPEKQSVINAVLGVLAIYFRANPQANLGLSKSE